MSDPKDAPPTRVGQAVTPQQYVAGGVGPDGQFFLDIPDDEMVGRGLINMLVHELDRYYVNKRMAAMLQKAKDQRIVTGMLGEDAPKIERKLRGLR